ncbi:hypothetical protein L6452_43261 [Arctium lappa]|uniref:Uncharacterized protein n=1 Tax=Arctium lappa TaxID=4217 RepID=A0ACB8XL44_ARCLA|nr:hypothetical protein L6452_43261 [Arctium lappa]
MAGANSVLGDMENGQCSEENIVASGYEKKSSSQVQVANKKTSVFKSSSFTISNHSCHKHRLPTPLRFLLLLPHCFLLLRKLKDSDFNLSGGKRRYYW